LEIVLVLNSGSSSLKYKVFDMSIGSKLASGVIERIGQDNAWINHKVNEREPVRREDKIPDHKTALEKILGLLMDEKKGVIKSLDQIAAVGHRVLHGKDVYDSAVIIDQEVREKLEEFRSLGPLHMPANLMGIDACQELMGNTPQVAVFDTAFHQTMPDYAYIYSLPYELYQEYGIRKYGFHGISHKYVAGRAAEILGQPIQHLKLLTLHLGNGCSIAAVQNGHCMDTTMGFTPLEGLTMGTRCGDLDPAVIPVLCEKLGKTPQEIDELLNKESGLLGISGAGSDMRDIEAARLRGNPRAQLAFEVFCYRIVKYIGSYMAVMGGVDAIIFTAGIGENMAKVRSHVSQWLKPFGLIIDPEKNEKLPGREGIVSAPESKVKIMVVPTNEELMIAQETYRLTNA
jgi:acetate kinase